MASEKSVFGSSSPVDPRNLRRWCAIPAAELPGHPELRVPYRQVADSAELGALMAMELIEAIEENNRRGRTTRAILPCGPTCWYEPFRSLVNTRGVSLKSLHVFHMDECLDWQGRPLPAGHPYNFRTFMERHFYGGIRSELAVPQQQRYWLLPGAGDALLAGVVSGLAVGLPFIVHEGGGGSFSGRCLQTALDVGVLNASFSVTSPHTIHPDAVLKNLFAFAESHGAFISDALRSVSTGQRQISSSPDTCSHWG